MDMITMLFNVKGKKMKRLMMTLSVATLMSASVAQAGLFDSVMQVAQVAQGLTGNQQAAQEPQQQKEAVAKATEYSSYDFRYMDCAELAVAANKEKRAAKELESHAGDFDKLLEQADQENAAAGNTKAIGGLMSMAGSLLGNKDAKTAEVLNSLGGNMSKTQSERELDKYDTKEIVKQHKAHQANIEDIAIYQKAKKCPL